ncbi:cation transport protein [Lactiplantibacillus plantarum]|nr:cation transport protein [Lactiplantibacillus plantarum]
MNKKTIGFFSGIAVFAIIYFLSIAGLSAKGQMDLALSLMTVVWWATQIAQPAFVGGIYLMCSLL